MQYHNMVSAWQQWRLISWVRSFDTSPFCVKGRRKLSWTVLSYLKTSLIKVNYKCLLPIVTKVFIMINVFLCFSSCPCIWDHEQSLLRRPPPPRSPAPRITLKLRFAVILGAKLPWRPWCLSASCILRSSFLWGLCASARSMSWNSYIEGCSQQHRDTETELNTVNLGSTTITIYQDSVHGDS